MPLGRKRDCTLLKHHAHACEPTLCTCWDRGLGCSWSGCVLCVCDLCDNRCWRIYHCNTARWLWVLWNAWRTSREKNSQLSVCCFRSTSELPPWMQSWSSPSSQIPLESSFLIRLVSNLERELLCRKIFLQHPNHFVTVNYLGLLTKGNRQKGSLKKVKELYYLMTPL